MYWWQKQSKFRKALLIAAIMALLIGLSGTREMLTGGIFLFFVFLVSAFFVPARFGESVEEKTWQAVISPHLYGKEKWHRLLLAVFAGGIALIVTYFLFKALLAENYINALLFSLILLATISSFIYLFPKLYNEIFLRTKIIPLSKKMDTKALYEEIRKVKTPAGIPLLGHVEGLKEVVAVYRIIDYNWVVYFYVYHDEVLINSRLLFSEDNDPEIANWVYNFTQHLSDLICFYVNTKKLPDKAETSRIFK